MMQLRGRLVSILTTCGLALSLLALNPVMMHGQLCPNASRTGPLTPSEIRTLQGTLVFHDSIRKWFELKLDEPQCGQTSIELVRVSLDDWRPLEVLRGCRVKSTGTVEISGTGYYSLDLYQDVREIESVGACETQPPFPDYSNARPDKAIQNYRVDMQITYEPGDHPIIFRVSSKGRDLQPWQAYANYMLTGGYVLYGWCGNGFVVDKVFGTPEANPSHFEEPRTPDDRATFDPESAAAAGKKNLHLRYTCVRKP